MHRLLVASVCIVAALASGKNVKNATAGGYYDDVPAAAPAVYGGYGGYHPTVPQLQDRNVCDLDASVLLVTDSRRHGHNRAVRVRCSEIASYDEDSCNICCQQAARRDRNLPNAALFGFLAVTDDHHHGHHDKTDDEKEDEKLRMKRNSGHGHGHHHTGEVEPTILERENWKPDPAYKNTKCVCCAPKRPLPAPQPVGYPQQPYYQQPAQASPPQYQQQAPPQYQAPQASPAQYQAPQASPAQYQGAPASPPQYQAPQASPPQQYQAQSPPQQYQAQSPPQQYQQQAQAPQAPQYQPPQASPPQYQAQDQAPSAQPTYQAASDPTPTPVSY